MLDKAINHLVHNVLAAAADYYAAEGALTQAYEADDTPSAWEAAARTAKRRAAEAAIAVDGLTDRCWIELGGSKSQLRKEIAALCHWPASGAPRLGAHERVRGAANAYKHQDLTDRSLPITSSDEVLIAPAGWNVDGWSVGKYGGRPEVLIAETAGGHFKFLGDLPVAIAAWFHFLSAQGANLPSGPIRCCNLQVHP